MPPATTHLNSCGDNIFFKLFYLLLFFLFIVLLLSLFIIVIIIFITIITLWFCYDKMMLPHSPEQSMSARVPT